MPFVFHGTVRFVSECSLGQACDRDQAQLRSKHPHTHLVTMVATSSP